MDQQSVEKARKATSAEDLAKIARQEGVTLSKEDAEKYYSELHPEEGELSDSELNNVSGGSCYSTATLAKEYAQVSKASTCGNYSTDGWSAFSSGSDEKTCLNCSHATTSTTSVYFCKLRPVK